MTLPGPQQNTARRRIPTPRVGALRRYGTPSPPAGDAVTNSGATAWFDSRDGSGLQQIPSRIGAGVATLGSTTGVDTNDPTWGSGPPFGWTFDTTDDYIDTSGTGMLCGFDSTTSAYTHLQVVTMPGVTSKQLWCCGNSSVRHFRMQTSGTTQLIVTCRGSLLNTSSTAQTVGGAGTRAVVGFVISAGIANTYVYVSGAGTLGTSFDTTGHGFTTANQTVPRYGTFTYVVSGSTGAVLSTAVEWNGVALSKADMDTVSAYLIGLY